MSDHGFEVGAEVVFTGGQGKVVNIDRNHQKDLLKILTTSGQVRVIPDNVPFLKHTQL